MYITHCVMMSNIFLAPGKDRKDRNSFGLFGSHKIEAYQTLKAQKCTLEARLK